MSLAGDATSVRVMTPSDLEITLRRSFDAPAHLVFAAWTQPDLLVRWFGARGWNLVECEVDLRVGGTWRFVSRGPGGAEMTQSGVYRDIEPARLLVHTESYDGADHPDLTLLVTTRFVERAGRTTVTSTILHPSREARDRTLRTPMERGLRESHARLDVLLASVQGSE
ncbi:SRPBCC family protein [Actinoalloteichus spitiensis]|uniref:SRPBCC family protein n=1 Tax=Actinoalloteichus spitiensis TaxID=252394 RepID=UPI000374B055|nr:SRPBCC family protein [Actinoalloteichus spitiensis]